MTKVVTVNRRHMTIALSILVLCILVFTAFSYRQTNTVNTEKTSVIPEVKMLSVTLNPASITKDMTYGNITLKGAQVIPAKTFDLTVTVQNTTAKRMQNIPIELTCFLVGDASQKIVKPGSLQVLEPGSTAKVTFRGIKAMGDSIGKSSTAGLHEFVISINSNPQGGVNQASEASYRFLVDSTVKVLSTAK